MIPSDQLTPYLIANGAALAALAVAYWRRGAVRWIAAALFAWAAFTNARIATARPEAYVEYASFTVSSIYRDFILGWFSQHVTTMVLAIAVGQAVIAVLLAFGRGIARAIGTGGAVVFLLAIAPLGVGSGFPFSLTFIAALLVSAGAADLRSPHARAVIRWMYRACGVGLAAFLALFAFDVFGEAASLMATFVGFAIHLLPALLALTVVALAWRHEWLGGLVYFVLAVAYAAMSGGRVSWMAVVSLPLLSVGVLCFWSAMLGRRASR